MVAGQPQLFIIANQIYLQTYLDWVVDVANAVLLMIKILVFYQDFNHE